MYSMLGSWIQSQHIMRADLPNEIFSGGFIVDG